MTVGLTLRYQGPKENLLGSGLLTGMGCSESNSSGCELKHEQSADGSKTVITFNGEDLKTPGPLLKKFAANLRSAAKAAYLFDPDGNPLTKDGRHEVSEDEFSKAEDKSKFFKIFDPDSLDSTGNTFLLGAGNYTTFLKLTKNIPVVSAETAEIHLPTAKEIKDLFAGVPQAATPAEAPPAVVIPAATLPGTKTETIDETKTDKPVVKSDDSASTSGFSLGVWLAMGGVSVLSIVAIVQAIKIRNLGRELAADKASRKAAVDRAISAADRADKLVGPLEAAQSALEVALDEHEVLLNTVRDDVAAAIARIETVKVGILDQFKDHLGQVKTAAHREFLDMITAVRGEITALSTQIETETARLLTEVGRQVGDAETRLMGSLRTWMDGANANVDGINKKVGDLDEKTLGALGNVETLKSEASTANEVLRRLDGELGDFSRRLVTAFDRLVTAEGTDRQFEERVSELKRQFEEAVSSVSGMNRRWRDFVQGYRGAERQQQGALDDFRASVQLALSTGNVRIEDLPPLDLAPLIIHTDTPEVPELVVGPQSAVTADETVVAPKPEEIPAADVRVLADVASPIPNRPTQELVGLGVSLQTPVATRGTFAPLRTPDIPLEAPASVKEVDLFKDFYGDELRTYNDAGMNQVFYDAEGAAFKNNGVNELAKKLVSLIDNKHLDAALLLDCLEDDNVRISGKAEQSIALIELALNVSDLKTRLGALKSKTTMTRTLVNLLAKNQQNLRVAINARIQTYSRFSAERNQLSKDYYDALPKTATELAAKLGVTASPVSPVEYLAQIKTQLSHARSGWYAELASLIDVMEALATARAPDGDMPARVTLGGLGQFMAQKNTRDIHLHRANDFLREPLSMPEDLTELLFYEDLTHHTQPIAALITSLVGQNKYPRLVEMLRAVSAQVDLTAPGLVDEARTSHILAITRSLIEEVPYIDGAVRDAMVTAKVTAHMDELRRAYAEAKAVEGRTTIGRFGERARKDEEPARK